MIRRFGGLFTVLLMLAAIPLALSPERGGAFNGTGGGGSDQSGISYVTTSNYGGTDIAAHLESLIAAMPSNGGRIEILCGAYTQTTTLDIGDGGAAASTKNGIAIVGRGMASRAMSATNDPCVKFTWAGAASGTMVSVNGPIQGVEFGNVKLFGADAIGSTVGAGVGLKVISMQRSHIHDLDIEWVTIQGLVTTTVNVGAQAGTLDNVFDRVKVSVTAEPTADCVLLGGLETSTFNTTNNLFNALSCSTEGSQATAHGILLFYADNNIFIDYHCVANNTAGDCIVLGGTVAGFPAANYFYSATMNDSWTLAGTLANIGQNFIYGFDTRNGGIVPINTQEKMMGMTDKGSYFGGIGILRRPSGSTAINPPAGNVQLFVSDLLNVVGGAPADCILGARLSSGAEVTVTALVTDGGCP